MSRQTPPLTWAVLATIVFAYCLLGFAYALETPEWQTPDEPAHYNYVVYLADNWRLPVLQMGDYPHQYLERIKAAKFPSDMSIEPIRYESHQPPLYYVLAATLYRVADPLGFDGQFLVLRLFSVLLGAILLLVAFATAREIFPADPLLSLTATAMIATVPMHIAMSAAINNDTLAELILALVIWLCVREIKTGLSQRLLAALGLLLALALLTKTNIYAPALLCTLVALWIRARQHKQGGSIRRAAIVCGLALLASPWFVRNVFTYGDLDLFGWRRHDAVVIGQPTTPQWISQHGLAQTIQDFLVVSFRSFWAQFGWMGVLVDSRLYLLVAVICVAVAAGLLLFLVRVARYPISLSGYQRWALALLLLVFVMTALAHVGYNLKFVQHQGRYLFPALVPISVGFALGLLEWPRLAARALSSLVRSERARAALHSLVRGLAFSVFYAGFLALDVVCLYLFIVPQLRT